MTERFLGYGRHLVDEADIEAVVEVLRGEFLTQGPTVPRFEEAVAERVGARHAVAVSSGTAALHLACLAAHLGPGTAGVTAALTFVGSANAMLYCGAEPLLADIDAHTLTMGPAQLQAVLDRDVELDARVVMPVHFAGLAADSAGLRAAAGGRVVVEDAAQALGGTYEDGSPVGSCRHSEMTVFSLHPVKSITTGEGGVVTTNDDELAHRLRLLRNHGIERSHDRFVDATGASRSWWYEQQLLGFNYRLTDIQAALGLSQLQRLDAALERRRELALRYDKELTGLESVSVPQSEADHRARSALHLYVVLIDFEGIGLDRAVVMDRLRSFGVGSQVHFIPVYRQPFHRDRGAWSPDAFPATESYYRRCLTLPLHAGLTDAEAERVVDAVSRSVRA